MQRWIQFTEKAENNLLMIYWGFIQLFFKRSIVVNLLFCLFVSWIAAHRLKQACSHITESHQGFSNSSWTAQITRWELQAKEHQSLQNFHFKFLSFGKLSELLRNISKCHPCKSNDTPAKTLLFTIPIFHGFTWKIGSVSSVVREKRSSFFSFSSSGLDASVVRCQVALFPSGWLCDSLKMRREDNELFFRDD